MSTKQTVESGMCCKQDSVVKSMFFALTLHLFSLVTMQMYFFHPVMMVKGGFGHAPIHLDRGRVSLGIFLALPRWPPNGFYLSIYPSIHTPMHLNRFHKHFSALLNVRAVGTINIDE